MRWPPEGDQRPIGVIATRSPSKKEHVTHHDVDKQTDGWIDGWMNGLMDGWIDG